MRIPRAAPGEPRAASVERRARASMRAAIKDRLLHDLHKMSSARDSEMARADSDLVEILHDYQTDLMDDDELTSHQEKK